MLSFLTARLHRPMHTLNALLIHKDALLHNYSILKTLQPGADIFPVLKSNAYGHGLKQVSTILKESDAPLLCVDSFPEYQLVKQYSGKKVLVMGETLPENYKQYNPGSASLAVYTLETLKALVSLGRPFRIHLFLNTGMNREGVQEDQLPTLLALLHRSRFLMLEGVMSHFAMADEIDATYNDYQVTVFKRMYQQIVAAGFSPKRRHMCNSGGIAKVHDELFTACRSGLAFYGYSPLSSDDASSGSFMDLRPALTVQTTVISLQQVAENELVSYAGTFRAQRPTVTATLPFGYYEGLRRALSNQWSVERNGHLLPQVGNICMNLCSIDTHGFPVAVGDTITVVSPDPDAQNSIAAFAHHCQTIPYEVLVKFTEKSRRTIV